MIKSRATCNAEFNPDTLLCRFHAHISTTDREIPNWTGPNHCMGTWVRLVASHRDSMTPTVDPATIEVRPHRRHGFRILKKSAKYRNIEISLGLGACKQRRRDWGRCSNFEDRHGSVWPTLRDNLHVNVVNVTRTRTRKTHIQALLSPRSAIRCAAPIQRPSSVLPTLFWSNKGCCTRAWGSYQWCRRIFSLS